MVGEKLGSFRIEGTLGVGAMGVVYRAIHEPSGKAAAVKVVNKELAQRGTTSERFNREAEILKQFRHPNIVRFLALGRSQGTAYIAMEFIPGRTLEQVLTERGPLPWKVVVELGIQVCDALQYAHEHGVVHRDLKPSNLMVTESGALKLTDFGIAKDLDKTALTATGRTLGTAAYMAPEQIRGTPEVSHKTDLYALGIVFYQMLTGRPPFEGNSPVVLMHAHMNEAVPRASARLAEIPKALDNLIVQLMAKAPTDRPWDAAAVGETLKQIHDKSSRGENVAMVWPTEDVDPLASTRGADTVNTKERKKKRSKAKSSWSLAGLLDNKVFLLETAGLVLALAAIGGFAGYMLWPPSASYLFARAGPLMASPDRHKWSEALETYIEPLDRRFSDHPYKQTTRDWRDKIALATASGRARVLESPSNTRLNQPKDEIEERFVEYFSIVSAAKTRFDEIAAVNAWDELSRLYRVDDPHERPWHQLARQRAGELRKSIALRRKAVEDLLVRVETAAREGRTSEAEGLLTEARNRYGRFSDVSALLGLLPADSVPPSKDATSPPTPTPSSAPPAGP